MLIGITGLCEDLVGRKRIAGAGKDVVASHLCKQGFVQVAWADPLKRFCKEVYNFTDEQLWGESDARILPDKRYIKPDGSYLTPRHCLQSLGTNWGRQCYLNTWVDYGIRVAKMIISGYGYTPQLGLLDKTNEFLGVVFSDVRFNNEFNAIKEAGGYVVRVKRKLDVEFDEKAMNLLHDSETELSMRHDDIFDYILDNSGSLSDLEHNTKYMLENLGQRNILVD